MVPKKDLQDEFNELKTRVAILENQFKKLDNIPTYEKTENMINHSIERLPDEDKIIVMVQETIKKENLVTEDVVEKKLTKLKLWLYVTLVGIVGLGFKLFI